MRVEVPAGIALAAVAAALLVRARRARARWRRRSACPRRSGTMRTVQIGESYVGEGMEAAHVNTVLGERSGPVGVAWTTALATPTRGHAPFLAVIRPGLAGAAPDAVRQQGDDRG